MTKAVKHAKTHGDIAALGNRRRLGVETILDILEHSLRVRFAAMGILDLRSEGDCRLALVIEPGHEFTVRPQLDTVIHCLRTGFRCLCTGLGNDRASKAEPTELGPAPTDEVSRHGCLVKASSVRWNADLRSAFNAVHVVTVQSVHIVLFSSVHVVTFRRVQVSGVHRVTS